MSRSIETLSFLRSSDRLFVMETVVALHQARGGVAAVISAHANSVDSHLRRCDGVDASKVLFSRPTTLQQAGEVIECLARSGAVSVIVVEGYDWLMEDIFFSTSLAEICDKSGAHVVHLQSTQAEKVFAAEEEDRLAH